MSVFSLVFVRKCVCSSGYLDGEAAVGYVLATELHIDVIVPGIVQGIQNVKEAILLDHINVHDFAVKSKKNYKRVHKVEINSDSPTCPPCW